jgi:hypothetical protein
MDADGSYTQRSPKQHETLGSQEALVAWTERQHKEATRLKKRRTQGPARRNIR